MLAWLKPDYVQVAAERVGANQKQDPGMRLISLRCVEKPRMTTRTSGQSNVVTGVTLEMALQIPLVSGSGQKHRIKGLGMAVRSGNGADALGPIRLHVARRPAALTGRTAQGERFYRH